MIAHIARCPVHGLHGQRTECFRCGRAVEQVAMIPLEELKALIVGPDHVLFLRGADYQPEQLGLLAETISVPVVVLGDPEIDVSSLDEEKMRELGWIRAPSA